MLFRIKISINIIWLSGCEGNFNDMSKKVNFIFKRILLGEEPREGEFMGSVFSPTDSRVVYNSFLFVEDEFWTTPASSIFKFKLLKEAHFCRLLETSDGWWWKGQAMPCLSFSWTTAQMSAAAFKWSLLDHSSSFWSFPDWLGSCFCVSWLLCIAVPTALNGYLASCDVPGNCFQCFFKQQLANMAHYGSLALNNELLSLVFVPWVLLSAPTHRAKCGLSLGSPGGTGSWVSSYRVSPVPEPLLSILSPALKGLVPSITVENRHFAIPEGC